MLTAGLKPVEGFDLTRQVRELPRELLDAVFAAPRSSVGKAVELVTPDIGKQFLFQISEISDGQDSFSEEQLVMFNQQATNVIAQQELNAYIESLKQSADIKRY